MTTKSTILFLADPHLGEDRPGHQASFDEVVQRAAPMRPQLVVVLGDVTEDGKLRESYFDDARRQIARFDCEVLCIPGNHEEGYNVHRTSWSPRVERSFLERFARHLNPMPWSRRVGAVRVLGIDSQILGSGFEEETLQRKWLADQLQSRQADDAIVVVMHTPLYLKTHGPQDDEHDYWAVPHAGRGDLLACLQQNPPAMLLAGHVHRQINLPCDFCTYRTLASSSFQAHTLRSVPNDRLPEGSDDLCFYTMDASAPLLQRHVLDHQDRYR